MYVLLRGGIESPWLIGFLSLLFIVAGAFLVVRILKIKNPVAVGIVCLVMTVNLSVTATNATYLSWSDIFMLAMLLNVLAVWLWQKWRFGWLDGAVCVAAGLALYQAYIDMEIGLILVTVIVWGVEAKKPREVLFSGIKATGMLAAGGLLYFAALMVVCKITGVELANSYIKLK